MYPLDTTNDILRNLIDEIKNNIYNISKLDVSICIPTPKTTANLYALQVDDIVALIEYANAATISLSIVWKDGSHDIQKLVIDTRDYKLIRELAKLLYEYILYKLSLDLESEIGGHALRKYCDKIFDIDIKTKYKYGKIKVLIYDRLYNLIMSIDFDIVDYHISIDENYLCLNTTFNNIPTPEDIKKRILEYLNCT